MSSLGQNRDKNGSGSVQIDTRTSPTGEQEHHQKKNVSLESSRAPSASCDVGLDEEADGGHAVSTKSKQATCRKVPLKHRAGLLARFSLLYEAEEPKNYPRRIKWYITFIIGVAALSAPMGSSIILPALTDITNDFGADDTITNLSIALYMLAMALFPLWWSSFSETTGRRTIYIISFAVAALWNVLAALSRSISMFIVMRFLSGGAAAAVQAVGAGTVADCWEPEERGRAIGIFYLGPLCGPLLSPIIGGALTQSLGWRSTQWFQVIFSCLTLLLVIFSLPETHRTAPLPPNKNDEKLSSESTHDRPSSRLPISRTTSRTSATVQQTRKVLVLLRRIFLDPLRIVLYLRFPAVALTVYYASIAFGSLYFLNISIQKTFSGRPYHFSVIVVGCLYLFNSTGYLIASVLGGRWVDYIMAREARRAGRIDPRTGSLHSLPEDRMRENVWVAAFVMPAALLTYGWTTAYSIYWIVPMIANFFFGAGSMLLFAAATTMLTEFMPKNASNGVALNNCIRNIFSFGGSFLASPLIDSIGNGWLFTILAGVAGVSCVVIVLMRRYGYKWREEMDRLMD